MITHSIYKYIYINIRWAARTLFAWARIMHIVSCLAAILCGYGRIAPEAGGRERAHTPAAPLCVDAFHCSCTHRWDIKRKRDEAFGRAGGCGAARRGQHRLGRLFLSLSLFLSHSLSVCMRSVMWLTTDVFPFFRVLTNHIGREESTPNNKYLAFFGKWKPILNKFKTFINTHGRYQLYYSYINFQPPIE